MTGEPPFRRIEKRVMLLRMPTCRNRIFIATGLVFSISCDLGYALVTEFAAMLV